jgi:4-amino-4-deoxy-L-arabinose transferase-like glycosyltransferase
MIGLLLFGNSLLPLSLLYAAISIAAVIALYETVTLAVNQKTALAASAFLATSPLALAHARMPYHITPIPLAMVLYLWSVYCIHKNKKWSIFWAAFAWGVLFQFELATAPLFLLIIYALWRTDQLRSLKNIPPLALGTVLSLLPQLIYDVTHSFSHLGGFAVWIVYRIASFSLGGSHQFSLSQLGVVADSFSLYVGRMWFFDQSMASVLAVAVSFMILLLISLTLIQHKKPQKYMEYAVVATWILIGAYIVHGSPSEAYMPPFLILLPLVLGYWWQTVSISRQKMLVGAWVLISLINIVKIVNSNWFVSSEHPFSYGPGSGEQLEAISIIKARYQDFSLTTTDPGGVFPKYLDNYRWWLLANQLSLANQPNKIVYIDLKPSQLSEYPNTTITTLKTIQLVEIYDQF